MNPNQFDTLSEQLNNLQKTLDVHIRDSDNEAKDNQEYRLKVINLEGEIEELRKQLNNLTAKIQDKMAEVAQPIIEEAQDLRKTIDKKKTIIVPEKPKKPWWRFWERK